jgi:hypothetical protein
VNINLVTLILGSGALVTALYTLWNNVRTRRITDAKQAGEVQLDKATTDRIIAEATKIGAEERIARERWWAEQIEELRRDLAEERHHGQRWRERLIAFEDFFFSQHVPWDREIMEVARQHNWTVEPPPSLEAYVRTVSQIRDVTHKGEAPLQES